MKRFTETNKWDDPWYRNLSPQAKHLLNYLRDKCDSSGVVEIDFPAASFHIGEPIKEKHLAELESRLQRLPNGKILMPKFISFQYGTLSAACPAHQRVLKLISVHGLERVGLEYRYPSPTLALPIETSTKIPIGYPSARVEEEEEEEEEDKEGGMQGGGYHKDARTVLHILNEASGRSFREVDANLSIISQRLKEPGVDLDGMRAMISRQCQRWLNTTHAEYLRPETLFGKTKFDGYYAARNQPVILVDDPKAAADRAAKMQLNRVLLQ